MPLLLIAHDTSLQSILLNDKFLKTKSRSIWEPAGSRTLRLDCKTKLIIFWKLQEKSGAIFENLREFKKGTVKSVFTAIQMWQLGFENKIYLFDIYGITQILINNSPQFPQQNQRKIVIKQKIHTLYSTSHSWYLKCVLTMAPPVGLEPTTCGLTVRRSTDWAKGAYMLALPIFPGRHQPSIVGAYELNFCVRDGNRWTLIAINTNYSFLEKWWPIPDSNRC